MDRGPRTHVEKYPLKALSEIIKMHRLSTELWNQANDWMIYLLDLFVGFTMWVAVKSESGYEER